MSKDYSALLKAAKADQLTAIIPGMAAEEEGFHFSQENVDNMAEALSDAEKATAEASELKSQIEAKGTEIKTLTDNKAQVEKELADAQLASKQSETRIAELEAQVTKLGGTPNKPASAEEPGDDPEDEKTSKANDLAFQQEIYKMIP